MENPCGPSFFRACVVGVGSVGQCVLRSLTSPEGMSLTLIDGDVVEAHNIGRQPMCTNADVGRYKVDVAHDRLVAQLSPVRSNRIGAFIHAKNVREFLAGHAVVLDCTDDLHVRFLIDDACASLGIPLISGSVHGKEGQVVLLHAGHANGGKGPSLRDLFPGPPSGAQDGCDMRAVPPFLPDRVAARMLEHLALLRNGDPVDVGVVELITEEAVVRFAYAPEPLPQRPA